MKGTAVAFLILAPTVALTTFLFWNAAAEHNRGVLDDREVVAVLIAPLAALVAVGLLALFV